MPYDQVMKKWKGGELHSGSKSGPKVKSQAQAVAIMLSEKRKAEGGKKEYKSRGHHAVAGLHKAKPKKKEEY